MPAKKPMTISSAANLQINSQSMGKKDWCKLPQPQTPVAHTDTQKIQTHVTPCMLKIPVGSRTDRQSHDDSIYRASTASHSKNNLQKSNS